MIDIAPWIDGASGRLVTIGEWAIFDSATGRIVGSVDFQDKFIVVNGYQRPMTDQDGIVTVGLIPFLLESAILDGGLAAKRNMEVPTVG